MLNDFFFQGEAIIKTYQNVSNRYYLYQIDPIRNKQFLFKNLIGITYFIEEDNCVLRKCVKFLSKFLTSEKKNHRVNCTIIDFKNYQKPNQRWYH